jgi:hypothetical protein
MNWTERVPTRPLDERQAVGYPTAFGRPALWQMWHAERSISSHGSSIRTKQRAICYRLRHPVRHGR